LIGVSVWFAKDVILLITEGKVFAVWSYVVIIPLVYAAKWIEKEIKNARNEYD
jgi:hypothetical protein